MRKGFRGWLRRVSEGAPRRWLFRVRYSPEAPSQTSRGPFELIVSRAYSPPFGVIFRRSMGGMAKHLESLEQLFIVTGPFWASKERHLRIPGLPYRLSDQVAPPRETSPEIAPAQTRTRKPTRFARTNISAIWIAYFIRTGAGRMGESID